MEDTPTNKLLERAITAQKESKHVDFKAEFDPNSRHDWCEIIKDIVAMANSGGGAILIGLKDDGKPSNFDTRTLFNSSLAILSRQEGGCALR
jgi:predicted HTH transcriptional regulator